MKRKHTLTHITIWRQTKRKAQSFRWCLFGACSLYKKIYKLTQKTIQSSKREKKDEFHSKKKPISSHSSKLIHTHTHICTVSVRYKGTPMKYMFDSKFDQNFDFLFKLLFKQNIQIGRLATVYFGQILRNSYDFFVDLESSKHSKSFKLTILID